MNGDREERLLALAFEDIQGAEAEDAERELTADPESAAVLQQMRSMRSSLRELGNVPAPQISKERLRDAILGQGLKPVQQPWISRVGFWKAMPVGALAMVGVIAYVVSTQSSTRPPEASSSSEAVVAQSVSAHVPQSQVAPSGKSMEVPVVQQKEDMGLHTFGIDPVERLSFVIDKPAGEQNPPPRQMLASRESRPPRQGSDPSPSSTKRMVKPETEPKTIVLTADAPHPEEPQVESIDTIVLIAGETDFNTGAQRATEVSTASNVLVGG